MKAFQVLKLLLLGFIASPFFYGTSIKTMDLETAREIVEAYKTLGVGQNETLDQIKKVWKKSLLQWHPDKCDTKKYTKEYCEDQTKKINNAFDKIKENWNLAQFAWKKVLDDEKKSGKTPTPTPAPAVDSPEKAAKLADQFIQQAQQQIVPKLSIELFAQAIQVLKPHAPATSAKIIKTYVELINLLITKFNAVDDADYQLQRAQKEQKQLASQAGTLEKFIAESKNLKAVEEKVFQALAQAKPDIALKFAVRDLNVDRVKQVLENVKDKDFFFQQFWIIAGKNESNAAPIIVLIKNKKNEPFIDINRQAPSGPTALMHAAQRGSLATIQELLKFRNIDVNKQNEKDNNKTALDYAYERKDLQIVINNALINAGAKTSSELLQKPSPQQNLVPLAKTLHSLTQQLQALEKALQGK
jgi:curved DNA-binding protein CbpA